MTNKLPETFEEWRSTYDSASPESELEKLARKKMEKLAKEILEVNK